MTECADWLWDVLDASRPSLRRLADWLEAAPREQIEQYILAFNDAAEQVAEYWDGPEVDGVQYSEDATEDLCMWVVSQGKDLWQKAVARELSLEELARLYQRAERGEEPQYPKWVSADSLQNYQGYLAPHYLPLVIYTKRFGEDLMELLDALD